MNAALLVEFVTSEFAQNEDIVNEAAMVNGIEDAGCIVEQVNGDVFLTLTGLSEVDILSTAVINCAKDFNRFKTYLTVSSNNDNFK